MKYRKNLLPIKIKAALVITLSVSLRSILQWVVQLGCVSDKYNEISLILKERTLQNEELKASPDDHLNVLGLLLILPPQWINTGR